MRSVGIIAEYNPLHTGHKYHIQKARKGWQRRLHRRRDESDFVQRNFGDLFG